VEANSQGSVLRQTAIFDPAGLAGLLYWYMLYPVHRWIFAGMLNEIAAVAGRRTQDTYFFPWGMTVSFHSAQQFGALSLFPMYRQQIMICDPSGLPVTRPQ
jgi:Protein of unknown function (DUF2867)